MKKFRTRIAASFLAIFLFLPGGLFATVTAGLPVFKRMRTDSVGIEKKDGKRFILHRVDEGQTLYALARRYGRSVAEIKAANPDMGDALRYDQLVRVPIPDGALTRKEAKTIDKAIRKEEKEQKREAATSTKSASETAKTTKKTDDPARSGIHVVEPGQTLYSLAVRYSVAQADLRKWNSLPSDNVLIGQALIVNEKAYLSRVPATTIPTATTKTPDTPTRTTPVRTGDGRSAPNRRNEDPVESKPERTPPSTDNRRSDGPRTNNPTTSDGKPVDVVIESPKAGNDAPMPTRGRRISASGVAEMIDGIDGSGKYLALHRTAPIGTLVQVRNEFNNQSVWVKVIGRLPDTGVNDKILIKLSAQAFAKLSPQDRRFRAEVSYIVQ